MLVEAKRTPEDVSAVRAALEAAWEGRFGERIHPDVLALLLTLADLETGDKAGRERGVRLPNVFHHNLGNITIASANLPTAQGDWYVLSGDEGPGTGSNAKEHFYRVFPNLDAGALGLVQQLTRESRQHWWDGLLTGDPEAFVRALGGENGPPRYFEASTEGYLRAFNALHRLYAPDFPTEPDNDRPEPEPDPLEPAAPKDHGAKAPSLPSSSLPWVSGSPGRYQSADALPELRLGHEGPAVALLQCALNDWPDDLGGELEEDGKFGPATHRHVEMLQSDTGAVVDGIVGPRTWSILARM